jgi:hypothetical protein
MLHIGCRARDGERKLSWAYGHFICTLWCERTISLPQETLVCLDGKKKADCVKHRSRPTAGSKSRPTLSHPTRWLSCDSFSMRTLIREWRHDPRFQCLPIGADLFFFLPYTEITKKRQAPLMRGEGHGNPASSPIFLHHCRLQGEGMT